MNLSLEQKEKLELIIDSSWSEVKKKELNIEAIEVGSSDYMDIQETKKENAISYSIEEAKVKLGMNKVMVSSV